MILVSIILALAIFITVAAMMSTPSKRLVISCDYNWIESNLRKPTRADAPNPQGNVIWLECDGYTGYPVIAPWNSAPRVGLVRVAWMTPPPHSRFYPPEPSYIVAEKSHRRFIITPESNLVEGAILFRNKITVIEKAKDHLFEVRSNGNTLLLSASSLSPRSDVLLINQEPHLILWIYPFDRV